MNSRILLRQCLTFIVGLFIMSLGVTFSVKANLGVSPVSCVPYIYSLKYPLTLGQSTIIMNIILILLQIVLLRKNYQLFQLIQLPVVFLFGYFIDLTMKLFSWMTPNTYIVQALICILGCIVLALGVFFEVKAKFTYLPGEGFVMAVNKTFNIEFGKAKIGTDSAMVIIGIISSIILLSTLKGIREGTIIAAFLVGYIVRFINGKIRFLDHITDGLTANNTDTKEAENNNLIITISREFGSGGDQIGKAVAKKLGITFYDKNLIQLTSDLSGFTKAYIKEHEQKLAHSLLYQLYEQNYAYIDERKPPLDALFMVQSKIIRDISQQESCVIVGRCANFILKDQPNVFNIFIHAHKEFRVKRIMKDFNLDAKKASHKIDITNKERAHYCKHFTGKDRNNVDNYHLTVNSFSLGIDKSIELILEAINDFQQKKEQAQ